MKKLAVIIQVPELFFPDVTTHFRHFPTDGKKNEPVVWRIILTPSSEIKQNAPFLSTSESATLGSN